MPPTRPAPRRPSAAGATLLLLLALSAVSCASQQRVGSVSFRPALDHPAYAEGTGPRVGIDEGHCNYHTAEGLYKPFAELLRRDGFVVGPLQGRFTAESLGGVEVVVIANALACGDKWKLPTPAAFQSGEVAVLEEWVDGGGALLLIADHMPFPGAAENLARAFGFAFINGYAQPDDPGVTIRFERSAGTLADHAVTNGRSDAERVDAVATFIGQGFRALRSDVVPILTLPANVTVRLPQEASKFSPKTPRLSGEGLLQGAVVVRGKGRVAVFGEAAMFSAQEYTQKGEVIQFGMNAPGAEQNAQLALNVMHWLAGATS